MKSLKPISLAIVMLVSFVSLGQEKDSISKMLNHQMPNLAIVKNTSKQQNHRCIASIKEEDKPLIVVDNKIMNYSVLTEIDPNHIESINVIKGTEATALYGTAGLNGVLLIKTKNLSKEGFKLLSDKFIKEQDRLKIRN
jgi:TonB-dependent SusC/RagA subfamily outer membrane receptor